MIVRWIFNSFLVVMAVAAAQVYAKDDTRHKKSHSVFRSCMLAFGFQTGWSPSAYFTRFEDLDLDKTKILSRRLFRWDDEIGAQNPNGLFIENVRGEGVRTFFTVENILVKELNKKVDKNIVTSTINHYKRVFLETLEEENKLEKRMFGQTRQLESSQVIAAYNDFKSFRLLLGRDDDRLTGLLRRVTRKASALYAREVTRQSWFKTAVADGRLRGLAADPARWHLAGIGKTLEEADLASRFGRIFTTGSVSLKRAKESVARREMDPSLYQPGFDLEQKFNDFGAATNRSVERGDVFFDYSRNKSKIFFHLRNSTVTRKLLAKHLPASTPSGLKILEPLKNKKKQMVLSTDALEVIRSVEIDANYGKGRPGEKQYLEALGEALEAHFGKGAYGNSFENLKLIKEYFDEINMYAPGLLIEKRVQIDLSNAKGSILAVDFRGAGVHNLSETQKALVRSQEKLLKAKSPNQESKVLSEFLLETRKGEASVTKLLKKMEKAYVKAVKNAELPVSKSEFTGDDGFSFGRGKFLAASIRRYIEEAAGSRYGNLFRSTVVDLNYRDTGKVLSDFNRHRYIFFGEEIEKALRKKLKGKVFRSTILKHLFFGVHVVPNQSGGGKIHLIVGSKGRGVRTSAIGGFTAISDTLNEILSETSWDNPRFRGFRLEMLNIP